MKTRENKQIEGSRSFWAWTIRAYLRVRCLAVPQNKVSFEWFRLIFYYMIHIGKLIEEELRNQERTVTWFAEKLCYERTNVYSIFKRESIDTMLLFKISKILNHNFFLYYMDEWEQ